MDSANVWGKLKAPETVTLTPEQCASKATIRQVIWEKMEVSDIANLPRPIYHRIPNYKGANLSGGKVVALKEFVEAKTVVVAPDKPQEEVRFQTLINGKELMVRGNFFFYKFCHNLQIYLCFIRSRRPV